MTPIKHLSIYGSGEGNLAMQGGALQVGARAYWSAFDGVFIDAHLRFADYKNWALNSTLRTEMANPGGQPGPRPNRLHALHVVGHHAPVTSLMPEVRLNLGYAW